MLIISSCLCFHWSLSTKVVAQTAHTHARRTKQSNAVRYSILYCTNAQCMENTCSSTQSAWDTTSCAAELNQTDQDTDMGGSWDHILSVKHSFFCFFCFSLSPRTHAKRTGVKLLHIFKFILYRVRYTIYTYVLKLFRYTMQTAIFDVGDEVSRGREADQHQKLISIQPSGSRFQPWFSAGTDSVPRHDPLQVGASLHGPCGLRPRGDHGIPLARCAARVMSLTLKLLHTLFRI